jgi:chromosome segregation ATPase
MDLVQEHVDTGLVDAPVAGEKTVSLLPLVTGVEDDPGAAALNLIQEAAMVVRRSEDHCTEMKSRTRALLERAIEQLERAAERIESLEADCQSRNALIAEANARALMTEDALKRWEDRFGAIEAQISAAEFRARSAEARAIRAEDALREVEEAIRSQILGRKRSTQIIAAAA